MSISSTYASPGLRHGLLLEDHPLVDVSYTLAEGTTVGIPEEAGGRDLFVIATISFPDGRSPAVGWKPWSAHVADGNVEHESDRWQILCTKALGRALKRAGYPDDLTDLKALVHWRQRNTEIAAITAGTATVSLEQSRPDLALAGAGRTDPEDVGPDDDGTAPDEADVVDAEVVEPNRPDPTVTPPAPPAVATAPPSPAPPASEPTDEGTTSPLTEATRAALRTAINRLGPRSSELTRWARTEKLSVSKPASEQHGQRLLAYAASLLEPPEQMGRDEKVATITELADGLSKGEVRAFAAFTKSIGVTGTWDDLDDSKLDEVLTWLDAGTDD